MDITTKDAECKAQNKKAHCEVSTQYSCLAWLEVLITKKEVMVSEQR